MNVVEVKSPKAERDFIRAHVHCNQSDPRWIRPLDTDILQVFDPNKNKAFRFGAACRWVLYDNQKPVGRIAAFVNKKYKNKGDEFPVGGIGFFDSPDNSQAAFLLFDTAKEWLAERGMKAMDGPINFGERDRWWGLLVHGFYEPLYGMNYNPPYYQQLFEAYGFGVFYNQYCWSIPVAGVANQLQSKFYEAHNRFVVNAEFQARSLAHPAMDIDTCIQSFCTVYNKAWAIHEGNKEMSVEQAGKIFKAIKPILDPTLVWFVYHHNEPIAMWISIPDINQIIKHLHGKFNLLAKARFLYHKIMRTCNRFVGIIYGIVPEFQGSGVDYFMIVEAEKVIKAKGIYKQTELLWQGDFNPKMLNISRNLGAEHCRTLITWRYIFDRTIPFKRHPVIGEH
ncbi:MAG TPA: hypothetical protein PLM56_07425 [Cyclobacteriaceae bacterium]|jgi:hypothetical protein|nr:hypothetical protein [Cytophagales bacterium]HRE67581.1 hypothetical protein [Cyclobacteriaceae bacterium]HRF33312.1 hypothetical protein [Cyclobacteriaceae bacterium]